MWLRYACDADLPCTQHLTARLRRRDAALCHHGTFRRCLRALERGGAVDVGFMGDVQLVRSAERLDPAWVVREARSLGLGKTDVAYWIEAAAPRAAKRPRVEKAAKDAGRAKVAGRAKRPRPPRQKQILPEQQQQVYFLCRN